METVGRVVALATVVGLLHGMQPKHIPINVDDTGVGGGVTDRLRELGYSAHGVDFGGKANAPEDYCNRGPELWFEVVGSEAHRCT